MRTLRAMRSRIRAAKNIQQITRAMKLVSAARLRRAQDRVLAARPYAQRMHEIMRELGRAGDLPDHPLLQRRPVRHVGFVLITSDRGLCGAYNMNLIRTLQTALRDQHLTPDQVRLLCIGRRGYQFFAKRGYTIALLPLHAHWRRRAGRCTRRHQRRQRAVRNRAVGSGLSGLCAVYQPGDAASARAARAAHRAARG
jgi:ATP synthase F1 gamma subunit